MCMVAWNDSMCIYAVYIQYTYDAQRWPKTELILFSFIYMISCVTD